MAIRFAVAIDGAGIAKLSHAHSSGWNIVRRSLSC
jgi:hypothetical protein